MIALWLLCVITLIILWFLLSPMFGRIGGFIINMITQIGDDEINNNEEKEITNGKQ